METTVYVLNILMVIGAAVASILAKEQLASSLSFKSNTGKDVTFDKVTLMVLAPMFIGQALYLFSSLSEDKVVMGVFLAFMIAQVLFLGRLYFTMDSVKRAKVVLVGSFIAFIISGYLLYVSYQVSVTSNLPVLIAPSFSLYGYLTVIALGAIGVLKASPLVWSLLIYGSAMSQIPADWGVSVLVYTWMNLQIIKNSIR
jgi:hypothetical protein